MIAVAEAGEPTSQRMDSRAYHLALLFFSKSLFGAQRRFFEFNEIIEDMIIYEESGTVDKNLLAIQLSSSLAAYKDQLIVAHKACESLSSAEAARCSEPEVSSEIKSGYRILFESEFPSHAERGGLIPPSSAVLVDCANAMIDGGDDAIIKLQGTDLHDLLELCGRMNTLTESMEGEKPIALMIREVETPLMPFCLRSMTLWIGIMSRQIQWAYYNATAFRSLGGVEVTTDEMLKAIE